MTAPQLPPGHVVAGKYSVVSLLGYGGSWATYHAVTAERREVILKVYDPALAQRADVMGALQQSYAGTNAMPADAVAHVLDAGYDASGAPFSAAEIVRLPSLAQRVAQRVLSTEELAGMLKGLAQVLDAAHIRQMAHLSLKPTNVFVGPAPAFQVQVTDFGASYVRMALPTQEGYANAGPWLAPEQLQGAAMGPAADVYVTALLAFFALTGRSYWRSCAGGAIDFASLQRELSSPPPPVSVRAGELGTAVPPSLDVVFLRALAADPAARYRSVGELSAAIVDALTARPAGATESAATVVFDVSALPPLPDMPPAGAAPGPSAMRPGMQQPGMQQPGMQPGPTQDPGGGMQMAPAVAMANPAQPATATTLSRPPLASGPPEAAPPRAGSSKAIPIALAVAAVLLVGVAGAAWVFLGGKEDGTPLAAPATASGEPVAVPVPTPVATAEPTTAPAAVTTTATAPAPEADAGAAQADAGAAAEPVEVAISCVPDCDEIRVDDQRLAAGAAASVAPGNHRVFVTKAGFVPQSETITVEAGKRFEKQYQLAAMPKLPTGGIGAGPGNKPCGKFLKRCN